MYIGKYKVPHFIDILPNLNTSDFISFFDSVNYEEYKQVHTYFLDKIYEEEEDEDKEIPQLVFRKINELYKERLDINLDFVVKALHLTELGYQLKVGIREFTYIKNNHRIFIDIKTTNTLTEMAFKKARVVVHVRMRQVYSLKEYFSQLNKDGVDVKKYLRKDKIKNIL